MHCKNLCQHMCGNGFFHPFFYLYMMDMCPVDAVVTTVNQKIENVLIEHVLLNKKTRVAER